MYGQYYPTKYINVEWQYHMQASMLWNSHHKYHSDIVTDGNTSPDRLHIQYHSVIVTDGNTSTDRLHIQYHSDIVTDGNTSTDRLQRISFLTKNWRHDENWPSWRKYCFWRNLTKLGICGKIWTLDEWKMAFVAAKSGGGVQKAVATISSK